MGELKTDQWVQFICFKTRIAIGEELFQETWIPLAKALHARGINSVALSQKVNAKDDSCDFVLITKTWWDAINAIKGAFPNGLQAASLNRVAISIAQVGCFRVKSCKRADKNIDADRHETIVEDEIKTYIMTTQSLSLEEIMSKAENLCLLKGFQSYCIYELDRTAFPDDESEFYSWIIEVYVQAFFKDSVVDDIHTSGQFKDWELTVHEDVVKFSM